MPSETLEILRSLLNKARSIWFHRLLGEGLNSVRISAHILKCEMREQSQSLPSQCRDIHDNQLVNRSLFRLIHRDTKPMPLIHCQTLNKSPQDSSRSHDHRSEARLRIDPKVLVFVETTYSKLGREIAEELVYNRIKWVKMLLKDWTRLKLLEKWRSTEDLLDLCEKLKTVQF